MRVLSLDNNKNKNVGVKWNSKPQLLHGTRAPKLLTAEGRHIKKSLLLFGA